MQTPDALTVDGAAVTGAIGSAGDEDYFSFSGTSGEWLHVETVANPTGDPAKTNRDRWGLDRRIHVDGVSSERVRPWDPP